MKLRKITGCDEIEDALETTKHLTYFYLGKYTGQRVITNKDEVEAARLFSQEGFDDLQFSGVPVGQASANMIRRFWSGEFNHLLEDLL